MRVAQGADASGRTPMRKKTRVGYGCCDVETAGRKTMGKAERQTSVVRLQFSKLPVSVQVILLK